MRRRRVPRRTQRDANVRGNGGYQAVDSDAAALIPGRQRDHRIHLRREQSLLHDRARRRASWSHASATATLNSRMPRFASAASLVVLLAAPAYAQQSAPAVPTRAYGLTGESCRYRANSDLLFYQLDIRVDPVNKTIGGKNTIRFRMLADDTRIQIDLYANLNVDKILFGSTPLKYERELNAVFVD